MLRPVALHSVCPYLFDTGSWIHGQLVSLSRWRPVVVCKRRQNTAEFPLADVHALEDLPAVRQLIQRTRRRFNGGHYPFMVDVAHASGARLLHSHFATKGWKDLPLARATGLVHLTSFYGADIWKNSRSERWRGRFGELFERGGLFLVEGNAMRKKVESLGCPPDKIRVHHLGVDIDAVPFTERCAPADGIVRVLICGRATAKKGHELAIRAFARAHRSEPSMRLSAMLLAVDAGQRAEVTRLQALVEQLGLGAVIDFPPSLPYSAWRQSLQRYHVFFAPSMHAPDGNAEGGAPVALVDMCAQGLPVVASDHCDLPEVVPHGAAGMIFPEGDEVAAAAALLEVAQNAQEWPRWGHAGRAHVAEHYSRSAQGQALERIYDFVAG